MCRTFEAGVLLPHGPVPLHVFLLLNTHVQYKTPNSSSLHWCPIKHTAVPPWVLVPSLSTYFIHNTCSITFKTNIPCHPSSSHRCVGCYIPVSHLFRGNSHEVVILSRKGGKIWTGRLGLWSVLVTADFGDDCIWCFFIYIFFFREPWFTTLRTRSLRMLRRKGSNPDH